jgi:hypothetical protein
LEFYPLSLSLAEHWEIALHSGPVGFSLTRPFPLPSNIPRFMRYTATDGNYLLFFVDTILIGVRHIYI